MKISVNQAAPDFVARDAYGKTVQLSAYLGQKVFLAFFRVVGCPTCHFTFHEIQKKAQVFEKSGLIFLAVYQSNPELMQTYLEMEGGAAKLYGTLIADENGDLYRQYGVGLSTTKLISGLLFHGGFKKFKQGKKLYKTKIKDEGHTNRQGGEFLIDETGKIAVAHYGRFSGDFISLDEVAKFAVKKNLR